MIRTDTVWLRFLSRIVLIPVIAGVSYEFLRFAGRHDSKLVNLLSRPGMWMQGLTTTEPDDSMIEVAIAAVEEVLTGKRTWMKTSQAGRKQNECGESMGRDDLRTAL